MDVRSLRNDGVVYKAPERKEQWAVDNRVAQAQRSEAKNWARVNRIHGKEAAEDSEIVQDLEVIGWTGKDLMQQIETIKSSGATVVMIKIRKTEMHFIQAEMTAETNESELFLKLVKQGASDKELRAVTKAARELKTAWALNRAMMLCPTLLDTMAGEYRKGAARRFLGMAAESGRRQVSQQA